MLLKASSITNLADARFYASQGAQYIGFCFDPENPHFIHPQQASEIAEWIAGAQFIGELKAPQQKRTLNGMPLPPLTFFEFTTPLQNATAPWALHLSSPEDLTLIAPDYCRYIAAPLTIIRTVLEHIKSLPPDLTLLLHISTRQIPAHKALIIDLLAHPWIHGLSIVDDRKHSPGIRQYDTVLELFEKVDFANRIDG